jgi:hypothetical protein
LTNIKLLSNSEVKINEAIKYVYSGITENVLLTGSGVLTGNTLLLELNSEIVGSQKVTEKYILIRN